MGFLDIETSNLDADFGIILSYCIKDSLSPTILEGVITKKDIEAAKAGDEDKAVVIALVEDMQKFDRLVTYYGARFDIPYIRTRAMITNVEFPPFGSILHKDLYDVIKRKMRLSSNRLENACRQLLGKTEKTRFDGRYWRAGSRGDKKSLEFILDHNRKDVLDLEKLYNKTIQYVRKTNTSF